MNINWEVSFEEFNESKICGNIKGKRKICFEPKMEKIFPWKYSDHFSYFDHILLLWCWIDLILAATERELEDLNVCSYKTSESVLFKVKNDLEVDLLLKKGIDILYFPFWEACVLGFWMLKILKWYKGSHIFLAAEKPFFWSIFKSFYFIWKLKNLS